jgi:hypothetical protein
MHILPNQSVGMDACLVTESLLSAKFFYLTLMLVFLCLTFIGIFLLTAEQFWNILNNITANERINGTRYSWMKDESGNSRNRYDDVLSRNFMFYSFDRGKWSNFLEFYGVPGYAVNYYSVFDVPLSGGGVLGRPEKERAKPIDDAIETSSNGSRSSFGSSASGYSGSDRSRGNSVDMDL